MEPISRTQGTIHDDSKSMGRRFVDLAKFLSSLKTDLDLANVTAPPFFLAPSSVVENPGSWAKRPKLFTAPTKELDPAKRSLSVLQLFLAGLRNQLYVAGAPNASIKKPLNAFLGELFLASWSEGDSSTKLVVEQVSHHPPITAMHISSQDGIRADGYGRVEMTFNGNINIRQIGHAIIHIDRFDEDYLVPLTDVTVRGFLSACLYPEIIGTYTIVSSSGYISEIDFSGAGLFRGKRNCFEARIYHRHEPKKHCYKLSGVWSEGWKITDGKGKLLETYTVDPETLASMQIDPLDEQDPRESRRAWGDVISSLEQGNYRDASAAKHEVEEAQRQKRREEKIHGKTWEPFLFRSVPGDEHQVFHQLAEGTKWQLQDHETKGVWRIDDESVERMRKEDGQITI